MGKTRYPYIKFLDLFVSFTKYADRSERYGRSCGQSGQSRVTFWSCWDNFFIGFRTCWGVFGSGLGTLSVRFPYIMYILKWTWQALVRVDWQMTYNMSGLCWTVDKKSEYIYIGPQKCLWNIFCMIYILFEKCIHLKG